MLGSLLVVFNQLDFNALSELVPKNSSLTIYSEAALQHFLNSKFHPVGSQVQIKQVYIPVLPLLLKQ